MAISALMKAVKADPQNSEAIVSLAASLTNESMQSHACYALLGNFYLFKFSLIYIIQAE
jgi:hypothetical protein